MSKLGAYLRLIRPKHYLKNILVFLPLVFAGQALYWPSLASVLFGFAAFSLVASAVYVINDLRDKELDKLHPKKKHRPIASGAVSSKEAIVLFFLLLAGACVFQWLAGGTWVALALLAAYLLINIAYSFGLKNYPIIDIAILSSGFVIRVFYGADVAGVAVSTWLYLAILAFSFYLSLGKRRNEILRNGKATRKVNRFYTHEFLDKNMYVFLGLTLVYYTLWTIDPSQTHKYLVWTVPLLLVIVMAYSLVIEGGESDGDPVDVVVNNKLLLALVGVYGVVLMALVYLA